MLVHSQDRYKTPNEDVDLDAFALDINTREDGEEDPTCSAGESFGHSLASSDA